jgi:hypothetical protein
MTMLDGSKLNHDTYKHMATLSSGSLVLVATLAGKMAPQPTAPLFAWSAIICFLLSIIFSVYAMFSIAYIVSIIELPETDKKKLPKFMTRPLAIDRYIILGSCGSFAIGMLSVAIFGIANVN